MGTINIGYHVSHEQFSPNDLLAYVKLAENSGFDFASSSDHFHPWTNKQGHSGFAWAWLGAAMSQTSIDFSVVNCPGYRYHPAIIAQAAATLDVMFPHRFSLCVGSGEALNEAIIGQGWPTKNERNLHLQESVQIIRDLWLGKTVTHHGRIRVEEATLYTRPLTNISIVGAAITPETAAFMAPWTDELITLSQPYSVLKQIVDSWQRNGGKDKPMTIKVQLSYHQDEKIALYDAYEEWGSNIFASSVVAELRTPEQFEKVKVLIQPEQMYQFVNISADLEQHIQWLHSYSSLGFNKILLHNVNTHQKQFIKIFGKSVLPSLKKINL